MTIKYMVCSPGRSGSIFVATTIAKSLRIRPVMSNQESLPFSKSPIVYHSHDAQLQLDLDIPVLHVMRKNLYAEIISAIICEQYNEWTVYTGNKPPFVADLEIFEQKYIWHKYWHQAHRALTQYHNRQVLVFEDFIGRSEIVCSQLNIPLVSMQTNKSPYSEQNILNIDELKEKFNKLESMPPMTTWNAEDWKDKRSQ
jgi:hypothetical protein